MHRLQPRLLLVIACCLLLFTLLFTLPVVGNERIVRLPFVAEEGQEFQVRFRSVEKQGKDGQSISHVEINSTYVGRINETLPTGYIVTWRQTGLDIQILEDKTGSEAKRADVIRAINKSLDDIPVSFETNEAGLPVRVLEWAGLSEKFSAILRKELTRSYRQEIEAAALAAGKKQEEVAAAVESQVEGALQMVVLQHDERSAIKLFEEVYLIGGVQNTELPLGQEVDWSASAPSLISDKGAEFDAKGILVSVDETLGEAEITWTNTFREEGLREQLMHFYRAQIAANKTLSKQKADEILAIASKIDLVRVDEGRALIGMADGWAREINYIKRVTTKHSSLPTETYEKSFHVRLIR